jgi:hypothetical protein
MEMLRSALRISILWVLALSAYSISAQSPVKGDKIVVAKQVVTDLFPELKGRGLQIVIQDMNSLEYVGAPLHFALWIYEPVNAIAESMTENCPAFLLEAVNSKAPLTSKCPTFLASVRFGFDQDQKLYELSASGTTVGAERLEQLRRQVDSHPEWSDKDIEDMLKKEGAHFGPWAKDELTRLLPISVFRLLLGSVQISSVDFSTRDERQMKAHLASANLEWDVTLTAHVQGRKDMRYIASFEPFQGKLISLISVQADQ